MLQILSITPAEKAASPAVIDKKETTIVLSSFVQKNPAPVSEPEKEEAAAPVPAPVKNPETTQPPKVSFLGTLLSKIPKKKKGEEVPKQKQQIPLPVSSQKKSIPDSAREHFEASSAAFLSLAHNKENKNQEEEMDEWDAALLLGKYPGGKTPLEIKAPVIEKKESKTPEAPKEPDSKTETPLPTIKVPSKPARQEQSPLLPTMVTDPEKEVEKNKPSEKAPLDIKSFLFKNPSLAQQAPTMIKPLANDVSVPQKTNVELLNPEPEKTTINVTGDIIIPNQYNEKSMKPEEIIPISNTLAQKIIQNQVAEVFSGAPYGVRTALEKIPAKELLHMEDPEKVGGPGNVSWKKRLSEYLLSLKNSAQPILGPIGEPGETETSIDYAKRIVPIITKNDALKTE